MPGLNKYIKSVRHLPPAPALIAQLLPLFGQPDRDVDRIVQLISHDPALTAAILRQCNSSFFSFGEPAEGMYEAVLRLGFFEVYQIVVAVVGARTMSAPCADSGLDTNQMWRHAVAAAVAASVIARSVNESDSVAFTAGLLHDLGKVVLATAEGKNYAQIVQNTTNGDAPILERAAFGFDHAELGGRLLAKWDLPPDVVTSVSNHHREGVAVTFERLAAVIQLANIMAHGIDGGSGDCPIDLAKCAQPLELLQTGPDKIETLVSEAKAELERVQGVLAL